MTWPADCSPWNPGRLDVMLLVWLLIVLVLCQHMGPRPRRYESPAAQILACTHGSCDRR